MGSLKLIGEQEGGSDDHAALTNLDFASAGHTGFVASDGVAGGQTVKGGTGASENLTLQSTDDATRGVIDIIDSLRLTGNSIQDSGGNPRITLASSNPHLTLTGDAKITGSLALKGSTPLAARLIRANPTLTLSDNSVFVIEAVPSLTMSETNNPQFHGFQCGGSVIYTGNPTQGDLWGLKFNLAAQAPALKSVGLDQLTAIEVQAVALNFGTGLTIVDMNGLKAMSPSILLGATVSTYRGLWVQGGTFSWATTVYGLRIDEITGASTIRLMEIGPESAPYLRVGGGGAPGANQTNLYLNEGGNLRHVQVKDGAGIGAGDRVMVLV